MSPAGRPRTFDAEKAIDKALLLFWEHGYEGTSLAQLRDGMGISSASFYAAFRSKGELFTLALQRYMGEYGAVTSVVADVELTGRDAVSRLLHDSIRMQTDPAHPRGCLVAMSARMTGDATPVSVSESVARLRAGDRARITACIDRAIDQGELAPLTDATALAGAIHIYLLGISTQARDGVPKDDLDRAADTMLLAWDVQAAHAA